MRYRRLQDSRDLLWELEMTAYERTFFETRRIYRIWKSEAQGFRNVRFQIQ